MMLAAEHIYTDILTFVTLHIHHVRINIIIAHFSSYTNVCNGVMYIHSAGIEEPNPPKLICDVV